MDNLPSNLGAMPPRPAVASGEGGPRPVPTPPPIPLRPAVASGEGGPRPAVASGEGGPRPTPPPPPPPVHDFAHVAPVVPQKPAAPPAALAEVKTPPPPGPEVRVRSLQSDTETLAASGGVAAEAKSIRLEELENETPVFAPETVSQLPQEAAGGVASRGRLFMLIGASAAGVIIFGLAGYYLVYPLFFTAPAPVAVLEPTPTASLPEILPHVSLFQTPLPAEAQVDISSITPDAVTVALVATVAQQPEPRVLTELSVSVNGDQAPFADFITALIPELSADMVKNLIADDFSGFAYFDNNGHWPGYVAMLRPEAIPSEAQQTFAQMESANLAALYTNDPGVKGEFKSGQVNGVPTRYSIFTTPGASFNYGIFGNYLVISTSFDGMKAILPFLGL